VSQFYKHDKGILLFPLIPNYRHLLSHILHSRRFFVSHYSLQVLLCLTFFITGAFLSHVLHSKHFFVAHSSLQALLCLTFFKRDTSLSHILHSRPLFVLHSSLQSSIQAFLCLIFFTSGASLSYVLYSTHFFISHSSLQALLCLTFFKPDTSLSHILYSRSFFVSHYSNQELLCLLSVKSDHLSAYYTFPLYRHFPFSQGIYFSQIFPNVPRFTEFLTINLPACSIFISHICSITTKIFLPSYIHSVFRWLGYPWGLQHTYNTDPTNTWQNGAPLTSPR
jgi:hypothetical protein